MSEPLSNDECRKLCTMISALGDDVLAISAPELAKHLDLDARGLAEHLKRLYVRHNPHNVLSGEEKLNLPVLVLLIPSPPEPDRIAILSGKPEYRAGYEQYRKPHTTQ